MAGDALSYGIEINLYKKKKFSLCLIKDNIIG